MKLPIILLPNYVGEKPPFYATKGSVGLDLIAAIESPISLKPFKRALIANGFKMELPQEFEAQIRPRSGLAFNYGVTVLNSPGTIDSDYRGEIKTLLINLSEEDFIINPGARISQMVINRVVLVYSDITADLSSSRRGEGGFGSTGEK